jgi:hypothetical protein
MSALNGDKARFGKQRRRKLQRRERNRAVKQELLKAAVNKPA